MRLPDFFCLLVPVAAHATCQGRDPRLDLTPESQVELEQAIGKVPFPEGTIGSQAKVTRISI